MVTPGHATGSLNTEYTMLETKPVNIMTTSSECKFLVKEKLVQVSCRCDIALRCAAQHVLLSNMSADESMQNCCYERRSSPILHINKIQRYTFLAHSSAEALLKTTVAALVALVLVDDAVALKPTSVNVTFTH